MSLNTKNHINYIEMGACDFPATQAFFSEVFGWTFQDWGPEYCSYSGAGIDGGFFASSLSSSTDQGAALVILYHDDLEACLSKVEAAGGKITKAIFPFPGGRRFQFCEPSGNELSVWSDK